MSIELSRRDFLSRCSAVACAVSPKMNESPVAHPDRGYSGKLCLSKPLPDMDWRRPTQAPPKV